MAAGHGVREPGMQATKDRSKSERPHAVPSWKRQNCGPREHIMGLQC